MNRWMLSAFAVLLAAGLAGCAGGPHCSEANFDPCSPCPQPTDALYVDGCRSCYGATPCGGATHCGLCGKACCITRETGQLLKCLFSYRWEGNYPYGSLGPWEGSWSGGCGCPPGSTNACNTCNECQTAE